jgi:molecular chaperone GrpE
MTQESPPPHSDALASLSPTPESAPGPAAASGDPAENRAIEATPSLEQLLRFAELKAAEHQDAWLRAKADAENLRKRTQAEVAQARKYGLEAFGSELLPVKDSLEAALSASGGSVESYRSGVELTLRQLNNVFEKFNIVELNPLHEKFDPHRHQAVSAVTSGAPPNTVVTVMQKGYALHDRVLRPALVMVANTPEA